VKTKSLRKKDDQLLAPPAQPAHQPEDKG